MATNQQLTLENSVYHYFSIDQYGFNKVKVLVRVCVYVCEFLNRLQLGQKKAVSSIKFHLSTGVLSKN